MVNGKWKINSCYTIPDMLHKIPQHILDISKKFKEAGFEIYLVGGSIRDLLQQKQVKDWDFTTSATPEQMLSLFPDAFYDNKFGTVGIPLKNIEEIERSC